MGVPQGETLLVAKFCRIKAQGSNMFYCALETANFAEKRIGLNAPAQAATVCNEVRRHVQPRCRRLQEVHRERELTLIVTSASSL